MPQHNIHIDSSGAVRNMQSVNHLVDEMRHMLTRASSGFCTYVIDM